MPGTSQPLVRHNATEILVVGAGPTGLLLAAELARRGVACRVVDQAPARRTVPKAINLHARTLEIFDDLGIAEDAVAIGNPVYRLNSYSVSRPPAKRVWPITQVDLTGLDSRFQFTLTLAQPETERLIEQLCAAYGVHVEWDTRFTGLCQDGESVVAQLEHGPDRQEESVRVPWLVGCDGIDSTVRNALSLPFIGKQYPSDLICADVRVDWDRPHDEAHAFLSRRGTVRCMPMPGAGRWRLVTDVPPVSGQDGTPDGQLGQLQALADARGMRAALDDMTWSSRFNIYRYFAPRYRVGRVILAGDAAHVHSPLGAQGMNLGLQDAYNLAWKLGLVLRGESGPELLSSYEEERRAIADGVLRRTDRNTRLIGAHGSLAQTARNAGARILLRLPAIQRRLGRSGAQLSMNYRHTGLVADGTSPLRRQFSHAPAAGDRAPDIEFGPPDNRRRCHDVLHGTGHVLLLFTDHTDSRVPRILARAAQSFGSAGNGGIRLLTVTRGPAPPAAEDNTPILPDPGGELHRCWHANAGCLYLIRPDGYVGYRTTASDTAGLNRYLESIFRRI